MIEELYLYTLSGTTKVNYTLVDIDKVDIVRTYTSPYFRNVEELKTDGTYTIKLPHTTTNKAFFDYCHRLDMNSSKPYDFLYADYYYNGMVVFLNAEVRILDTVSNYEIQCIYGVNRKKYIHLFDNKLNEIVVDGVYITTANWIINWNRVDMFATGKKYKYLDCVSGERVSDVETISGVQQPKLIPDEPAYSSQKEMTQHPFILAENIIDLILDANRTYETFNLTITPTIVDEFTLVFSTDISDVLLVGDVLKQIDGVDLPIEITIVSFVDDYSAVFSTDMTFYYDYIASKSAQLIRTNAIDIFDFDNLKAKLTNKGIIENTLNGDLTDSEKIATLNYSGKNVYNSSRIPNEGLLDGFGVVKVDETDIDKIIILPEKLLNDNKPFNVDVDIYVRANRAALKMFYITDSNFEVITQTSFDGTYYTFEKTVNFTLDKSGGFLYFAFDGDASDFIISNSIISIKYLSRADIFSFYPSNGKYNCLQNLPKISPMEFIQQLLIHTCSFLGYDENGDFKVYFLDDFKYNLDNGIVYDWSGKVSNIRKSTFQFNSNAQKNYIKFGNDKDLTDRKATITVSDLTIDSERDLYNLKLDSPLGKVAEMSEYILYEQTVKRSGTDGVSFENKYVGDKWQCAFVEDVAGVAKNIPIVGDNYLTYQKIIEKPRVIECDVNLGMLESATIDFTKPIYLDYEAGRYAMLLELQAPNKEVCAAKLLLINQTL